MFTQNCGITRIKEITTTINKDRQVIINTVTGSPLATDYLHVTSSYMNKIPVKNIVWDFSSADLSGLTNDEIREIVHLSATHPNTQKFEKLAFILPSDLAFGLGRVFKAYGAIASAKWDLELFREKDDAFQWLQNQDGPVTKN